MSNESHALIPPLDYRDRRAGLVFFGAIIIGTGALCALMVPLLLMASYLMPPAVSGLNWRAVVNGVMVYSAMAVVLVWLGIGSILCRRWARTLLLIIAWSWLLAGVMILVFLIWLMRASSPDQTVDPMIGIAFVFTAVFCVALPTAVALFYQSSHVKATCEAHNPVPSWTDRCPSPVLTNSFWIGLGSLWLLITPLTNQGVVPAFGYLVSGTPANIVCLICAAGGVYLAWATYRCNPAAWWIGLTVFALASISAAITFVQVDLAEFYRKLGYSAQQVAQVRNLGFFNGRVMAWATMVLFLLYFACMLWIKKYFHKRIEDQG